MADNRRLPPPSADAVEAAVLEQQIRMYVLRETGIDLEKEYEPSLQERLHWTGEEMRKDAAKRKRMGILGWTIATALIGAAISNVVQSITGANWSGIFR